MVPTATSQSRESSSSHPSRVKSLFKRNSAPIVDYLKHLQLTPLLLMSPDAIPKLNTHLKNVSISLSEWDILVYTSNIQHTIIYATLNFILFIVFITKKHLSLIYNIISLKLYVYELSESL